MAGNLEFIKSAEITTTSTTLDVTDCFTSNYDVYQITFSGISTSTAVTENYAIRFLDTSDTQITANYAYAVLQMRASAVFEEKRSTSQSGLIYLVRAYSDPKGGSANLFVYNPTDTGSYTFSNWQSAGQVNTNLNANEKGIGVLKDTQEVTGIRLYGFGGLSMDSAKISVYGVK